LDQNLKTQISLGSLVQVPGAGSLKSAAKEKLAAPGDTAAALRRLKTNPIEPTLYGLIWI
jgi:hypothetical protein